MVLVDQYKSFVWFQLRSLQAKFQDYGLNTVFLKLLYFYMINWKFVIKIKWQKYFLVSSTSWNSARVYSWSIIRQGLSLKSISFSLLLLTLKVLPMLWSINTQQLTGISLGFLGN